jgi:enamine deaminase RidA (YjgF/YER057c/UK114 family)
VRKNIPANSPFDDLLGFSRVVAINQHAWVSATAPYGDGNEIVGIGNAYIQTRQCLENIIEGLHKADFEACDIIRTRIYLRSFSYKDAVMKAHREIFKSIRPACGVVAVSDLVDARMLVYIEADAFKPAP